MAGIKDEGKLTKNKAKSSRRLIPTRKTVASMTDAVQEIVKSTSNGASK